MKRIFSILALASIVLWSSSCLKLQRPDNSEKEAEIAQAMEKFVLTESVTVDVPEGKLAVVTLKGTTDTIAILPMTASIMVPSASAFAEAETKAKGDPSIDVDIIDPTGGMNVTEGAKYAGFSDSYFTLAFEDSFVGDYDYNDLVLGICLHNYKQEGKKAPYTVDDFVGSLKIKPIACGSRNKIGFGIRIGKDGQDILLTDDVRRDYFDGAEGFINTASWQDGIMDFDVRTAYSQNSWIGDLYFFISVGNYHLYAANTNTNTMMVDKNKCPYGIVVSNVAGNDNIVFKNISAEDKAKYGDIPLFLSRTWWRYPYESVSLDEAYSEKRPSGWFSYVLENNKSMANVCYFDRAKENKVFPSIVFREDGTVDPEKTLYYFQY